jgi:Sulfotransferase domain
MALKIVGAGVGRTGTASLKEALETLTGGRCYHMMEVFGRPGDAAVWTAVLRGDPPHWDTFLADFDAAVDWPACSAWRELAAAYPDAPVLLSTRDADSWWRSASRTIFEVMDSDKAPPDPGWAEMTDAMLATFTPDWRDETAAKAAFEAHNACVRAEIPADRLIEWRPGDGWEPLCRGLGVDIPDTPYPHTNTTDEFRAFSGLDQQ